MTEKTLAVYADTKRRNRCRGRTCGRWITWYELVDSGKQMCFDGQPFPVHTTEDLAGRVIHNLPAAANHWATCANRDDFAGPPRWNLRKQR
jgi:hypothetical protein